MSPAEPLCPECHAPVHAQKQDTIKIGRHRFTVRQRSCSICQLYWPVTYHPWEPVEVELIPCDTGGELVPWIADPCG